MAFIHIFAGLLAIVAGAVALSAAKGGRLHRRIGMIFVYAMLVMSALGALMAALDIASGSGHPFQKMNVIAGTVTFYLVATALMTVRRPAQGRYWIDAGAMAVAVVAGSFSMKFGFDFLAVAKGPPAPPAFVFGAVALLAALGDVRMMTRGIEGARRIARHLWRMGFAMFIATGSFFLGQAKVFPEQLRIVPLLAIPVVLVLLAMAYWWVRVSFMKRVPTRTHESGFRFPGFARYLRSMRAAKHPRRA